MEMKHNTTGFTFVEILVTAGIIALMSGIAAQIFISSSRNGAKSDLIRNIKQNGEFSLEVITRMIQSAKRITACSGVSAPTLTIENRDGGSTTFECSFDGTVTRIASRSGSLTEYLTTGGLSLGGSACDASTLAFVCTARSGLPSSVQINFTLSQIGESTKAYEEANIPFQTTVTTRSNEEL
ncbi:MAG: hypothetical protein UY08_C0012G0013 [Candidatus Gottesmanbacteria bacterium GW2011_GWA1_47_8]|uniref:Prepilin-type N-terminal cleavage/methylation domain-containing protein n=3 Tax=Candidatus Gottesmaniibacteriota TaxID=1752720 RepID=A0A0G1TFZ3_9BACT|nr:MAG: hypothetical protein UY08_C0012G0013 [Candidatus Gottesmanbacteria bacterium GW2011_GWA1_47_8]